MNYRLATQCFTEQTDEFRDWSLVAKRRWIVVAGVSPLPTLNPDKS